MCPADAAPAKKKPKKAKEVSKRDQLAVAWLKAFLFKRPSAADSHRLEKETRLTSPFLHQLAVRACLLARTLAAPPPPLTATRLARRRSSTSRRMPPPTAARS
jgi:hypothetical protein